MSALVLLILYLINKKTRVKICLSMFIEHGFVIYIVKLNSRIAVFLTKLLQKGWTNFFEMLLAHQVGLRIDEHLFFTLLNDKGDPNFFLYFSTIFFMYSKTTFAWSNSI